jgi:uncharacterized protein (DUF934 family)
MNFIDTRTDPWRPVGGEDGPVPTPNPRTHALLTLEQWHAVRDHWPTELSVGLQVPNTLDAAELAADLPRLGLVVLQFPKWVDGRAYSQARTLRARLDYRGEIRATGEVLVDMLPLLQRTGFTSALLQQGQSQAAAERALSFFAGHYQGDVHAPQPAFARNTTAELAAHQADAGQRELQAAADAS